MAKDFENTNNENEEEYEEDDLETIELIDEEGNSETFELLATFDLDGEHYLAVTYAEEEADEEDSVEVLFLKTVPDGEGNDSYVSATEEESQAAFDYFMTLVDAEES